MTKVSLIIPCYNVVHMRLDRMMASILNQNYLDMEIILVDDGSTNDTYERLHCWASRFMQKGYKSSVFTKTNGGIASAINVGLSNFTGEYVCFPDADDELMPNYVSHMASFLDENVKYNWVRSNVVIVNEDNIHEAIDYTTYPSDFDPQNVWTIFLAKQITRFVCQHMIRRKYLQSCIPSLQLYENMGSQEWQIVLPLSRQECFGILDDVLYKYFIYQDSHSHNPNNDNYELEKLCNESLVCTLKTLSLPVEKYQFSLDIAELGYITTLMRIGDRKSDFCSSKLSLLYEKYKEKRIAPKVLQNKSLFFFYSHVLLKSFLNTSL